MNEEVELAAKAIQAVTGALVEQTGLLAPIKQRAEFLTKRLYYRQLPALIREATLAAEKIDRLRLPRAAVNDPLVLRILEEGAWANDEDMQERWANLLANALTESRAEVHTAFSRILSELEPDEAATLEAVAAQVTADHPTVTTRDCHERTGIQRRGLDNLVRLELLRYTRSQPITWDTIDDAKATIAGVMLTDLGLAFLTACQTPTLSD